MISIGGEGSQTIALELFRKGMQIVGVPKTIDNDLSATEVTFGFDTAVTTATDAVDKIHTTAESHHRIMVVEVMGRDAGWIALEAGIAGGAHVILIPEIPFTIENVCKFVRARESYGKRFTIVVVAEGVKLPPELKNNRRAGSVGNLIGNAIAAVRQQGSAGQRAGTHPARRLAYTLRPHPGHSFWSGRGRSDCPGRVWQDGVLAQRAHRSSRYCPGHRLSEDGRSQRSTGADRPGHRYFLRGLQILRRNLGWKALIRASWKFDP